MVRLLGLSRLAALAGLLALPLTNAAPSSHPSDISRRDGDAGERLVFCHFMVSLYHPTLFLLIQLS
jgi:hypothetical protein